MNYGGVSRGRGTGLEAARHPLFFYTTADRQYHPDDLKVLLAQIDQVDLVSGFRQWQPVPAGLRGIGHVWRAFLRVVMGVKEAKKPCWLGWREERKRLLARLLFGLRVQDVHCAFRLFRREVFDRFPIQSDGAFAEVEVLAKANFLAWMSEEPVRYSPVAGRLGSIFRNGIEGTFLASVLAPGVLSARAAQRDRATKPGYGPGTGAGRGTDPERDAAKPFMNSPSQRHP